MRVLHILINEYDTIDDAIKAFDRIPKDMIPNGSCLKKSKAKAEDQLLSNRQLFGDKAPRMFWINQELFEDTVYYTLHEALFD